MRARKLADNVLMRHARRLLPLALAIAATTSGCLNDGVDRDEYTARNLRILDRVPVYPGARVTSAETIEERSSGIFGDNSGPPIRYTSYRGYVLPTGTPPEAVLAFYDRELKPRWAPVLGAMPCEQTYRHGVAQIYLMACHDRLMLQADHAAYPG
jgi:hypothetical protein